MVKKVLCGSSNHPYRIVCCIPRIAEQLPIFFRTFQIRRTYLEMLLRKACRDIGALGWGWLSSIRICQLGAGQFVNTEHGMPPYLHLSWDFSD